MKQLLAHFSASITELKKNPTALIEQAGGDTVAILNHNSPTAYLVPADVYEALLDRLEDFELAQIIETRKHEKPKAIKVKIDDL
jgi:antitoxin StbD